jgi:hypothetical protein
MKRRDVAALSFPDALAAGLLKKANPDHDVVAIGPKGMSGSDAVQRQIEEKTIKIAIIDPAIEKDHRNMMIKTIDCTSLGKRDVFGSGSRIVIHSASVLPRTPAGADQTGSPGGSTGTSHGRRRQRDDRAASAAGPSYGLPGQPFRRASEESVQTVKITQRAPPPHRTGRRTGGADRG